MLPEYQDNVPLMSQDTLRTTSRSSSPSFDSNDDMSIIRLPKHRPIISTALLTTTIIRRTKALTFHLLPSFIQSRLSTAPTSRKPLHPTACLDGLRGLSALIVFIFHFIFAFQDFVQYGYGSSAENTWFHQLPFVRLIYAGDFMVVLFFVISGYVLTIKPLRQCRAKQWDTLLNTMASSIFRRATRLFLPTLGITSIVALGLHMGMNNLSHYYLNHGLITGHPEVATKVFPTLSGAFKGWLRDANEMVRVWGWETHYSYYDHHLWTIPLEFRASLMLFLTVVGLAQTRPFIRLSLVAFIALNAAWWDRWEVILFLGGMFIAETDLIRTESRATNLCGDKEETRKPSHTSKIWIAVFVVGMYLGSWPPRGAGSSPGFRTLSRLIPEFFGTKDRFWPCIGGFLVVKATTSSLAIQRLYTNDFAQYFGRISYALYLCHGPMDHAVGYAMMGTVWSVTGRETTFSYCFGFFVTAVVHGSLVIWVADLFWRGVDVKSVEAARWVERKCFVTH